MLAKPRVRAYLADVVAADMVSEVVGIVLAPIMLLMFFEVRYVFDFGYGSAPPVATTLLVTMVIQLGLEFVVDVLCVRWETRYLDLTKAFAVTRWRYSDRCLLLRLCVLQWVGGGGGACGGALVSSSR